jgi:UDP-3-O-[3-hydroxymyristoyl] glucosamine N-acyltransferase
MHLSDLPPLAPVTVLRDGPIGSLGLIMHSGEDMLVFLESERYLDGVLRHPSIRCVIATEALADRLPARLGVAISEAPRRDFFRFHNHLAEHTDFYWRDFRTEIAQDALISPAAHIAEKSVRIGRRTVIEPHATVLPHTIVGDDVILRAGCVIGSQGFQFMRSGDEILPVAHGGGVWLHDRVEVQANCTIARALFGGFTELGEDTKLDSLVYVAHHVKMGKRCLVGAGAAITGSVTIGDDVWIGPHATIASEVIIGDRASITLGSVVTRDVAADQHVTGNFAIDHEKFIAFLRTIR